MAKFLITGGEKLHGSIGVLGAKNAAIKMIAGALLFQGTTVIHNVPDILDIQKIIDILAKMGVKVTRRNHTLQIDTAHFMPCNPDPGLVGAIRASIVLVGPLLARCGHVRIPHPGGCTIGSRPIDLHLHAFRSLGIEVEENAKYYEFRYQPEKLKRQATVTFPRISVTATENILLFASALKNHQITIQNAAIEPEIIDLIEFLKKAGAKIIVKNRTIVIEGQGLEPVTYNVLPDRIEAGTFAIMAAMTGSVLKIKDIVPAHLAALIEKLRKMGIKFKLGKDFLQVDGRENAKCVNIDTAEYPGFPTDLQPPMGALLTQAKGKSHLRDNIFEHRLEYLKELRKMGASIKYESNRQAEISGPTPLRGAKIDSLDLRAGATLLLAALTAQGQSVIQHAENIDRGYEKIETRLKTIGAKIKRE